jgi:hypothetical protein
MYNTTHGKNLRPARSSVRAAVDAELNSWLSANQYRYLADAEGQDWEFQLKAVELPEASKKRMVISVSYSLRGVFSGHDFCKCGVLNLPQDQRLLNLLGEEAVVYVLGQWHFVSDTLEQAKSQLHGRILKIRSVLNHEGLRERKKLMITSHLDRSMIFGF